MFFKDRVCDRSKTQSTGQEICFFLFGLNLMFISAKVIKQFYLSWKLIIRPYLRNALLFAYC